MKKSLDTPCIGVLKYLCRRFKNREKEDEGRSKKNGIKAQKGRYSLGKSREWLIHEKKFHGDVCSGLLQYFCRQKWIYNKN